MAPERYPEANLNLITDLKLLQDQDLEAETKTGDTNRKRKENIIQVTMIVERNVVCAQLRRANLPA